MNLKKLREVVCSPLSGTYTHEPIKTKDLTALLDLVELLKEATLDSEASETRAIAIRAYDKLNQVEDV